MQEQILYQALEFSVLLLGCFPTGKTFRCHLRVRLVSVSSACCSRPALRWPRSLTTFARESPAQADHLTSTSIKSLSTTVSCGVSMRSSVCGGVLVCVYENGEGAMYLLCVHIYLGSDLARLLRIFIVSNLPWSIKLFIALPAYCPLRRTPFLILYLGWYRI